MPDRLYRIGDLASRTGLSVRALRHYDAIGLLSPDGRTPAGHRLYSTADVERLQRVVSLRALGLPLASIAEALATAEPLALVEQHLALVRARIDAQARLAERLDALAGQLRLLGGGASVEDLFDLITLATMFDTHYTPEQLQTLKTRAETVGPDRIAEVGKAWAALFQEFDRHRLGGVAPEAPALRPLVDRAQALIGEFTGGDPGTRAALNKAARDTDAGGHLRDGMIQAWGIDREQADYYAAAMDHHTSA